jgi:predicted TIM-barrel fold metal-dependent hydrolase
MIIDFYTHVGAGMANHASRLVRPLEDTTAAQGLLAAMDRAGIDRAVTFAPRWVGGEFVDPTYVQANAAIYEAAQQSGGRLIGFGRVNPNYGGDAAAEVERCFSEYGFKGLMLDPEWENFDPADRELAYPLYEIARAHQAPILFHTWYSPSQPALYWELADDFSEIPIIISHLGGRLISDAVYIAQRARNVYLETSDNMYGVSGPARGIGPERILFGSHTPFSAPEMEMFKVTSSDLSQEEKDMVLGGNAARLLRLD